MEAEEGKTSEQNANSCKRLEEEKQFFTPKALLDRKYF